MAEKELDELCLERGNLHKKRKALEQQLAGVDEELGRVEKKLKANPIYQKMEEEKAELKAQEEKAEMRENAISWVEANINGCGHMSAEEKTQLQQLKDNILDGIEEIDIDDGNNPSIIEINVRVYRKQRKVKYHYNNETIHVKMDDEGDASMSDGSKTLVYNHQQSLANILKLELKWRLGGWFMAMGINFDDTPCACDVWSPVPPLV